MGWARGRFPVRSWLACRGLPKLEEVERGGVGGGILGRVIGAGMRAPPGGW